MNTFSYLKGIHHRAWPEGFVFLTQSERFLRSVFPSSKAKLLVQVGNRGVLVGGKFFHLEYFTGDQQPEVCRKKGVCLQIWSRLQAKRPKGWLALPDFLSRGAVGIVDLRQISIQYWETWSQYGRRYRRRWLQQDQYKIERVSREEFVKAYQKCTLKKSLVEMFSLSLKHYEDVYERDIYFWVAREERSSHIIAGLAVVYDQETKQTFHPAAFILPEAKKTYAQVGLMDHWFAESQKMSGIDFLNLGVMWRQVDPPSWKGYSEFKTHFSPGVFLFRAPLLRFFWNR